MNLVYIVFIEFNIILLKVYIVKNAAIIVKNLTPMSALIYKLLSQISKKKKL